MLELYDPRIDPGHLRSSIAVVRAKMNDLEQQLCRFEGLAQASTLNRSVELSSELITALAAFIVASGRPYYSAKYIGRTPTSLSRRTKSWLKKVAHVIDSTHITEYLFFQERNGSGPSDDRDPRPAQPTRRPRRREAGQTEPSPAMPETESGGATDR